MGRCYSGTCLAVACGNGRVDAADPGVVGDRGERCDDGNNVSGDGCSADCLSDETCGNNVLDGIHFEQCDDGNLVDHDGCSSTCRPELPRWRQIAIDQITPRTAVMVYDAEHSQVVLFGGQQLPGTALSNETWLWNGAGWVSAFPTAAPSARTGHGMAYDSARHRVVLFGGFDGSNEQADTWGAEALALTNDSWEWDGVDWTGSPPATHRRRATPQLRSRRATARAWSSSAAPATRSAPGSSSAIPGSWAGAVIAAARAARPPTISTATSSAVAPIRTAGIGARPTAHPAPAAQRRYRNAAMAPATTRSRTAAIARAIAARVRRSAATRRAIRGRRSRRVRATARNEGSLRDRRDVNP